MELCLPQILPQPQTLCVFIHVKEIKVRYQLYNVGPIPYPDWALFQICRTDRISGEALLFSLPSQHSE